MVARRPRLDGQAHARPREVYYPDSDGKPMAENDICRIELNRLVDTLDEALADQPDIYVSGNLLLYYEEGNPRASVAPDVFVVRGVPKRRRRIYKLWDEGPPPCFAIEVTSPSTRREDAGRKRELYARLGVQEYVLYDPEGEYLRPPLQVLTLTPSGYVSVAQEPDGSYVSGVLPVRLSLVQGELRLTRTDTGEPLLSPKERARAEAARAEQERQQAEQERQRAEQQRQRAEQERQRAEQQRQRAEDAERHNAELLRRIAELERRRGNGENL